ncbi:MAG: HNH endonuclease [Opitutaceae bacterium]
MKPISVQDVLEFAKNHAGEELATVQGHAFTIGPSPKQDGGIRAVYGERESYVGPSQGRLAEYVEKFNSLRPEEAAKLENYPALFQSVRSYVVPLLVAVRDERKTKGRLAPHNWYQLAFRAWPILTQAAADRRTITYGELTRALGIHHRLARFVLDKIQTHYLDEGLPPITVIVENWKGEVGPGFFARDPEDAEAGREKVYAYPWTKVPNPFSFASDGSTPTSIARDIVAGRVSAKDAYARVKVRGAAQAVFRDAVLQAYGGVCAISGDRGEPLLQAAHILDWGHSSFEQRIDPRNGILLSLIYHRMFDLRWIGIDDEYCVRVNYRKIKRHRLSAEQLDKLAAIDGKRLRLPAAERVWPGKKLLAKRRDARRRARVG